MPDKTKECPACAMEIDRKLSVCPICGYEFPSGEGWNIVKVIAIIMVILIFLTLIFI